MFLSHIPKVEDVESAWALLLHCAGGPANYMLRVVIPEAVQTFAEGHRGWIVELLAEHFGRQSRHRSNGSGHCHDCLCLSWRNGFPKHRSNESCGILGKLGRTAFPEHDGCHDDPPQDGRPHGPSHIGGSTNGGRVGVLGFDTPCWEALADGQRPPRRETTLSPGIFVTGGSTKLLQEWNASTEKSFYPS